MTKGITFENLFQQLSSEQQKDLLINNPNIVTALGTQRFDPETGTITLEESPFQQEQRKRQEALLADLTGSLTGALPSVGGEDVTQASFQRGRALLDPGFGTDRRRLEQQLADRGLPIGSEASNEALDRLERSQGTQLENLALSSVESGIRTSEFQRQQRFNEISSLLSGGQVGFEQFQPRFQGLDLQGAEQARLNRQFQGEQGRLQRRSEQRSALTGSFGQLGSAGIGALGLALSDARLKENIEQVDISQSGIPIYEFDYLNKNFGQFRYRGVIAQDLKEIKPEAIITLDDGTMMVNYSLIDVYFRRVQ